MCGSCLSFSKENKPQQQDSGVSLKDDSRYQQVEPFRLTIKIKVHHILLSLNIVSKAFYMMLMMKSGSLSILASVMEGVLFQSFTTLRDRS